MSKRFSLVWNPWSSGTKVVVGTAVGVEVGVVVTRGVGETVGDGVAVRVKEEV